MIESQHAADSATMWFRHAFGAILAHAWGLHHKLETDCGSAKYALPAAKPEILAPTYHLDGHWPRLAQLNRPLRQDFLDHPMRAHLILTGMFDVAKLYYPERMLLLDVFAQLGIVRPGSYMDSHSVGFVYTWSPTIYRTVPPDTLVAKFSAQIATALPLLAHYIKGRPRLILTAPEIAKAVTCFNPDADAILVGPLATLIDGAKRCRFLVIPESTEAWWVAFLARQARSFMLTRARPHGRL